MLPGGEQQSHASSDPSGEGRLLPGAYLPEHHFTVVREASPDDDEAMLEKVGRRTVGALERLYHSTSPRLNAVALRLLGNAEDAVEALQDTYLRIWEKAPSYDPSRSRAFTWMVMILRGLCLDRLRKRRVRAAVWVDWDEAVVVADGTPVGRRGLSSMASPGDDFLTAATLEEVKLAFQTLPEDDQRLVFDALFGAGTIEELAGRVSQPVGTVKSRLHRAISKLRTLLKWDHETT